jgi:ornithine cyclodeaminase
MEFLYLSQEDVVASGGLDMPAAIRDVELAFRLHNAGDSVLPSKTVLRWGDARSEKTRGRINAMPGYLGGSIRLAGLKWISSIPSNPVERNLPRAHGLIILTDVQTGVPLSVMDGTLISAVRTGAVTALAAQYLARSDATTVCMFGGGVQGRAQLLALAAVLPRLSEVRVYDPIHQRAQGLADEISRRLGLRAVTASSPEEACVGADVVVTATTSSEPIIQERWLASGAFYAQCGGNECDDDTILKADYVVVDDWKEISHRGIYTVGLMVDKGLIGKDRVDAELGEIVTGQKVGRTKSSQRIVFSSVGLVLEDVAVAARIYRTAVEKGLGQRLELWKQPVWV